jgi:electron transfer flavoprotein beta subunit
MMLILVPVKNVVDLVEELEVAENGRELDTTFARMIPNEFDEHALQQAILLQAAVGGEILVAAPDGPDVDDFLYTAAARGAHRLVKMTGDFDGQLTSHELARAFAVLAEGVQPDLILTGVQAHNDFDGSTGPLLAAMLEMPYVGYISGVALDGDTCTITKEYPGGLLGHQEVMLPAVLGIQSAEQPPGYIAISKIRQAMKTATIDEMAVLDSAQSSLLDVSRMIPPEAAERAEMLEGDEEQVAAKIVELLQEQGLI